MKRITPDTVGPWIGAAVALALFFAIFSSLTRFTGKASDSRLELQQRALEQASTQCYVIEGSYAPDLDYLVKNYGLILDESSFYYSYSPVASNIRPDIRVVPLGAGADATDPEAGREGEK